jgi:ribosomal protein S18 acetylase RimI-like enzyme
VLTDTLTFRTIVLPRDAARAITYHRDACRATFGAGELDQRLEPPGRYLKNLAARVEEFPDGHLLAFAGDRCVGQLELQVPYGLTVGYVNLFYVAAPLRRRGYGRLLHARAERYFRSWEASVVELHVSPVNVAAVRFYEAMGYGVVRREGELLRMGKSL